MPTKTLPPSPSLAHLKQQARDLRRQRSTGLPDVCQRIREFHPRFGASSDAAIAAADFKQSDALLTIAREYGFASWARLRSHVDQPERTGLDRPHHERIDPGPFRQAVDLLDDGDVDGLRAHLAAHPEIVEQRVSFEGGNYFSNPSLLEFIAENPIRHGSLPPTVVEITEVILDAGASRDQKAIDSALQLVCSGCVPRQGEVQVPLIDLLCERGAHPDTAMRSALGHGEFDAVRRLLHHGATNTLPVAAALGHSDDTRRLLGNADEPQRHLALAFAAQHGHPRVLARLLEAGVDPNRYNPVGSHAHSTPLHQAALAGHLPVVELLVKSGARLDLKDTHHGGTPLGWARHAGSSEVIEFLESWLSEEERSGA